MCYPWFIFWAAQHRAEDREGNSQGEDVTGGKYECKRVFQAFAFPAHIRWGFFLLSPLTAKRWSGLCSQLPLPLSPRPPSFHLCTPFRFLFSLYKSSALSWMELPWKKSDFGRDIFIQVIMLNSEWFATRCVHSFIHSKIEWFRKHS